MAQKGATPAQVAVLERELETDAAVIRRDLGLDIGQQPGCSASGGPGDAYYFDSHLPHRVRNVGDDAEIVSASTPPTF